MKTYRWRQARQDEMREIALDRIVTNLWIDPCLPDNSIAICQLDQWAVRQYLVLVLQAANRLDGVARLQIQQLRNVHRDVRDRPTSVETEDIRFVSFRLIRHRVRDR